MLKAPCWTLAPSGRLRLPSRLHRRRRHTQHFDDRAPDHHCRRGCAAAAAAAVPAARNAQLRLTSAQVFRRPPKVSPPLTPIPGRGRSGGVADSEHRGPVHRLHRRPGACCLQQFRLWGAGARGRAFLGTGRAGPSRLCELPAAAAGCAAATAARRHTAAADIAMRVCTARYRQVSCQYINVTRVSTAGTGYPLSIYMIEVGAGRWLVLPHASLGLWLQHSVPQPATLPLLSLAGLRLLSRSHLLALRQLALGANKTP